MSVKKSSIALFLFCVYSIMIAHGMVHVHSVASDFDALTSSTVASSTVTCSCGCQHQMLNDYFTSLECSDECDCILNHENTHHHHECNIPTVYQDTRCDGSCIFAPAISDVIVTDPQSALSSSDIAQKNVNNWYNIWEIPLPKTPYVLGSNSLRAPPVYIF